METRKSKKKNISLTFKTIAFSLFLSQLGGCAYSENKINYENQTIENEELNETEEIVNISENEYDYSNQTIDNYQGNSLYVALNLCGYDITFNTRYNLATTFGIEDYTGTIKQNWELLSILKEKKYESLVKVSEIEEICKKYFKDNSEEILEQLNLPETLNITRGDFSRVIKNIANYLSVDVNYYNNKIYTYIDMVNDIDKLSLNYGNIAWAYLMGYMDLDDEYNFNSDSYLTNEDFNLWNTKFSNDYNEALKNQKNGEELIIIEANQDRINRVNDLLNSINNNNNNEETKNDVNETNKDKENNNSNNEKDNNDNDKTDNEPSYDGEKHKHRYTKWKFYDINNEISYCNECGNKAYRKHKFTSFIKKLYSSNNDRTHKVTEIKECITCDGEFKKEYNVDCSLTDWKYNFQTKLEDRNCKICEFEETRVHEHTDVPQNIIYNYFKSNYNKTHKLRAVYNCGICNEEIELIKEENCNLGPWIYNQSTKKEERECDVCDYKETKEHIHTDAPSNLQYSLDKSNNNGTHKLKAVYNCDICKEPIVKEKDENCNLGSWVYNSSTKKEERKCNVCDYTETKEHKHTDAPSNLQYNYDSSNNNGTHKLKALYNCNICNEQIVLTKNEDCKYNGWTINDGFTCIRECNVCGYDNVKNHNFATVPGSVTKNPTMGIHNQTEKCTDCTYEKEVQVPCTGDGNKYYNRNGDVVTVRENCSSCGDVCVDDVHNHNLGSYIVVDDTNHKRSCDCGYESVEGHSFSDWVVDGSGQNSATCYTCGHTKTEAHTCELESDRIFPSSKTKDYCYEDILRCIKNGCNYVQSNRVGHNYRVEGDEYGALYTCNTCGYEYEEIYQSFYQIIDDENTIQNNEETEEENNKQLILN